MVYAATYMWRESLNNKQDMDTLVENQFVINPI